MKHGFAFLAILVSLVLFGCPGIGGNPNPTPPQGACTMDAMMCPDGSYVGRVPPDCDFAPCPPATSTPAPSATPPQMSPEQSSAEACRQSFIDQIYAQYQPSYCSGMPPCEPKTTAELKAMISIDTRSAPTIGFTYKTGTLCSVITHYGRANFAPGECTLRSFTIDREATEMVPC